MALLMDYIQRRRDAVHDSSVGSNPTRVFASPFRFFSSTRLDFDGPRLRLLFRMSWLRNRFERRAEGKTTQPKMNSIRIQHALTGYHRKRRTMICACGWSAWFYRKNRWRIRWASIKSGCLWRGHTYNEEIVISLSPCFADEEIMIGSFEQCTVCGHCKGVGK